MEKAETVLIDDGGCEGAELGGGDDLAWELDSASSFAGVTLDSGEEAGCFGAPKKEVMVAFALGFFELEVATSAAFRLRGVAMVPIN